MTNIGEKFGVALLNILLLLFIKTTMSFSSLIIIPTIFGEIKFGIRLIKTCFYFQQVIGFLLRTVSILIIGFIDPQIGGQHGNLLIMDFLLRQASTKLKRLTVIFLFKLPLMILLGMVQSTDLRMMEIHGNL